MCATATPTPTPTLTAADLVFHGTFTLRRALDRRQRWVVLPVVEAELALYELVRQLNASHDQSAQLRHPAQAVGAART